MACCSSSGSRRDREGCRRECPAVVRSHERLPASASRSYIRAIETEETCAAWNEEYGLDFPVVPDEDGSLFRALTNGWCPGAFSPAPTGESPSRRTSSTRTVRVGNRADVYPADADSDATCRSPQSRAVPCALVLGRGIGGRASSWPRTSEGSRPGRSATVPDTCAGERLPGRPPGESSSALKSTIVGDCLAAGGLGHHACAIDRSSPRDRVRPEPNHVCVTAAC